MNLLLADIGYDCEELNEPLGIEVLYTYVNKCIPEINTELYYSNIDGSEYDNFFDKFNPDIVGVSTHINTWQRFNKFYNEYCSYCKRKHKSLILLVGGILGTYEFENILREYSNTICIVGEGEEALLHILKECSLLSNLTYDDLIVCLKHYVCNNIAYIMDGNVVFGKRTCMQSLEFIDFPSDHKYLQSVIYKNGLARIESSRGCPWNKCTFCVLDWKYAGHAWRPYPLKKVIKEIIDVSMRDVSVIYFTDEEFIAGDYNRLYSFINIIHELKMKNIINPKIEFVASTSVQALLGKYGMTKKQVTKCLQGLKEIGFRSFFLGIESGCDSQLLRFNKGSTVKENEEAIEMLRNFSIETDIGYILFDPFLTVEELRESLMFLKRNGLSNHISRFAKRLRIVPYTAYSRFKGIDLKSYDNNSVEMIYNFKDKRIQKIFDCYSYWESDHLAETHTVQSKIRASDSVQKERESNIEKLEKIRKEEFSILSKLVDMALVKRDFSYISNELILTEALNCKCFKEENVI